MPVIRVIAGDIEKALNVLKMHQMRGNIDVDLTRRFTAPGRVYFLKKGKIRYNYWKKHARSLLDRFDLWHHVKTRRKALGITD
jgi:hypothetical protein